MISPGSFGSTVYSLYFSTEGDGEEDVKGRRVARGQGMEL